jgi:hypothetical protein
MNGEMNLFFLSNSHISCLLFFACPFGFFPVSELASFSEYTPRDILLHIIFLAWMHPGHWDRV